MLFHQPDLFQHYTLASPSLWWGNGSFLPQNEPWVSQKPSHILITLGSYEEYPEQDPNITEEQLQRINQRKQMRTINAHQLAGILENKEIPWRLFPFPIKTTVAQFLTQSNIAWNKCNNKTSIKKCPLS